MQWHNQTLRYPRMLLFNYPHPPPWTLFVVRRSIVRRPVRHAPSLEVPVPLLFLAGGARHAPSRAVPPHAVTRRRCGPVSPLPRWRRSFRAVPPRDVRHAPFHHVPSRAVPSIAVTPVTRRRWRLRFLSSPLLRWRSLFPSSSGELCSRSPLLLCGKLLVTHRHARHAP